jgi:hypothetical protein
MRKIAAWTVLAALWALPVAAVAAGDAPPPPRSGPLQPGLAKSAPLKPGPLKPGKSAGVRAAQMPSTGVALVGAGAIIAIIAVTASSGSSNAQPNAQSVPTTS